MKPTLQVTVSQVCSGCGQTFTSSRPYEQGVSFYYHLVSRHTCPTPPPIPEVVPEEKVFQRLPCEKARLWCGAESEQRRTPY